MEASASRANSRVLVIAILASFVAFLDGSVVNVALPAITKSLGGGLAGQQWTVDAYLIALGSLILVAGSAADRYGTKRILIAGLAGFGFFSLLCAAAPDDIVLNLCRLLQGCAGALLVPSSLALIIATFDHEGQAKAIGTWTAWTGIAFIIGPVLGGFLVEAVSWRLIFAINVIPIGVTLVLSRGLAAPVRENRSAIDRPGALLCLLGLAGAVFALIELPGLGLGSPEVFLPGIAGIAVLAAFFAVERRSPSPMLPLSLFRVRNFLAGNLATFSIYGGLSVSTFLIVIYIQEVGKYGAFFAGLSLVPVTVIMFFLSPRAGALSGRFGPRFFMTAGPLIGACGFLLLLRVGRHVDYVGGLLPAIVVFGIGLSLTVAPLTAAVLGAVKSGEVGISSAVNNAVARIAGLLAVAGIGIVVGRRLTPDSFHSGVLAMAALLAIGGIISWIGIRNPARTDAADPA